MPPKSRTTIVVDNGAATIKLGGIKGTSANQPRIITNAIVRSKGDKATYYGQELDSCADFSTLHYRLPFEKGYLVDWDAQKAIWDGVFTKDYLGVDPADATLLITEPYFNLPNLQEVYDQFVFEEYEFQAYHRCAPVALVPHGKLFQEKGLPDPECTLVVDSGFSYTHVVPLINGGIVWNAVKRIDVGGKLLTNHLKELVSFRQWNMMDETYIVNEVKEACCYVSNQFKDDLETCRENPRANPIVQEYILPDFSLNRRGRVRGPDEIMLDAYQVLYMNNERFSVPEILFRPDDIGLEQAGLPQTIAHSISLLPEDLRGMFWANIGLVGGSAKFPGFRTRLLSELRTLAPVDCEVKVYQSDDPILEVYRSAMAFASRPEFAQHVVTKEEYNEMGSNACLRKFKTWRSPDGGHTAAVQTKSKVVEDDKPTPSRRGSRGRGRGSRGRGSDTPAGPRKRGRGRATDT